MAREITDQESYDGEDEPKPKRSRTPNKVLAKELEMAKQIQSVKDGLAIELALFDTRRNYGIINIETGTMFQRPVEFVDEPTMPTVKPKWRYHEHSLPFRVGHKTSTSLPFGLTVVSGLTAAGKSTLVRALPGIKRNLCVENPDNIDELENLKIFCSMDAALLMTARDSILSKSLYAIDGLRAPLFEINGPAGGKGVIMPFFTAITRVSLTLARNGVTMLATVNPMDEDKEYAEAFLSKLAAAVPCLITVEKYKGIKVPGKLGSFTGTIASREERQAQRFTFDADDVAEEIIEEVSFTMPIPLADDPLLNAIQITNLQEK
jgi:hypothetical protein